MTLDPPEPPASRPLDELDVLDQLEAAVFASRRDLVAGDAVTARARYRRMRELATRLPG